MYPDEQTALAYTTLVEFIDGNGISQSEALQALTILSERIRALSTATSPLLSGESATKG